MIGQILIVAFAFALSWLSYMAGYEIGRNKGIVDGINGIERIRRRRSDNVR